MRIVSLSSGGIDSSVMMKLLKDRGNQIYPLFIDYGQLAAQAEWESCKKICKLLDLEAERMNINGFGKVIPSGITDESLDIVDDAFLPTRNLLLLTSGAAYGFAKAAYTIAIGLLSENIFPDQTKQFLIEAEKAISQALGVKIDLLSPLISLNKTDVLKLAHKYQIPLEHTYSCHSGNIIHCGKCISCKA